RWRPSNLEIGIQEFAKPLVVASFNGAEDLDEQLDVLGNAHAISPGFRILGSYRNRRSRRLQAWARSPSSHRWGASAAVAAADVITGMTSNSTTSASSPSTGSGAQGLRLP